MSVHSKDSAATVRAEAPSE